VVNYYGGRERDEQGCPLKVYISRLWFQPKARWVMQLIRVQLTASHFWLSRAEYHLHYQSFITEVTDCGAVPPKRNTASHVANQLTMAKFLMLAFGCNTGTNLKGEFPS
jgi:hypothetical protein